MDATRKKNYHKGPSGFDETVPWSLKRVEIERETQIYSGRKKRATTTRPEDTHWLRSPAARVSDSVGTTPVI